jgi:hypothetical protein
VTGFGIGDSGFDGIGDSTGLGIRQDWGFDRIGDSTGLGLETNPQSRIPNPESDSEGREVAKRLTQMVSCAG